MKSGVLKIVLIILLLVFLPIYVQSLTAEDVQNNPLDQSQSQASPAPGPSDQSAVTPPAQVAPEQGRMVAPGPNAQPDSPTQETQEEDSQDIIDSDQQMNAATPAADSSSTPSISEEEVEKGIKIKEERISLDLKGIDIAELLKILSLKMGLTIVPFKGVAGRVNIFLNDLTFEDALDVILISQDLAAERKGPIINIMTSAEYESLYGKKYNEKRIVKTLKLTYAKPSAVFNAISQIKSDIGKIIADEASGTILLIDIPEKVELIEQTVKELDRPLETEIFDLQYAKSADMKTHLSSAITTGPGELYIDERSSKVVVSDLPDKMKKIKRIVKALDEPNRQVFIEAEIVQIELNKEYQRQIDWERAFEQLKLNGLDFKGTFPVSPSFSPSPAIDTDYLKMTIGTLSSDGYSSTLKFLETFGDAKILSRPRIAVMNNQEAKVLVGTREAYITSTQSQADTTTITSESVEFIDVGVKLSLTPTINKDGFVTLKIKPEVSSVYDTITTEAGSRVPIVKTAEAETVVKVKDGTMVMIAGLMEDVKREDNAGIPVLTKIPVLGALFGSRSNQKKRTELIVFLTPHIFTGAEQIEAQGIQDNVPPDMIWDEAENIIMEEQLDKIGPKIDNDNPLLRENTIEDKSTSVGTENKDVIQSKIKGIKKY